MNIQELRSQSTARLFLLTVVTHVVYPAHFLSRLTSRINFSLGPGRRISNGFVSANFVFAYLSLAMFVPYILVPEGHPVETVSDGLDTVSGLLLLIWSFKVRNRLNTLLTSAPGATSWFHGFWTFFFQYLYINYKINTSRGNLQSLRGLCQTCGYDLTGNESGVCPECGETI